MFQYQTPTGQAWNPNDTTGTNGWAVDWLQGAQQAYANDTSLRVSDSYAEQALPLETDFSSLIPVSIAKVFRPTTTGHTAMAQTLYQEDFQYLTGFG